MPKDLEIYFSKEDFSLYRKWINLNMKAVTWQGKYHKEFSRFWDTLLLEGQTFRQVIKKFHLAIFWSKIGPLVSWFTWLRNRLIAFTFFQKEISLLSLSEQASLPLGDTAMILRNFFLEANPHLTEELSNVFQIAHASDQNVHLNFQTLKEKLPPHFKANQEPCDDVLTSMEVTLYAEWQTLAERLTRSAHHPSASFLAFRSKRGFFGQFKILLECLVMGFVVLQIIFLVKEINRMRNKKLVDKISIYEPQLKWLDKTLSFKDESEGPSKKMIPPPEKLESVDLASTQSEKSFEEGVRYDVESEVVLTSWDNLPKRFDVAEWEKSEYEENRATGYRDTRYGNTRVYRVMMKSADTFDTKEKLNQLIQKYQVTRVDNVRPGKNVPGGMYYNIFVPRPYLKEFMAQVMEVSDAVLYESRTRAGRNPMGKNKVFIWVKSI